MPTSLPGVLTKWLCSAAVLACLVVLVAPLAASGGEETPSPFSLSLAVGEGNLLEASLINRSGAEQAYLHDQWRQACQLELWRGQEQIPALDTRSRKKFDRTITKRMYETLAAKASARLHEERFRAEQNSTYGLRWGPFSYEGLKPGAYRARLLWQSRETGWVDRKTGKKGRIKGIWTGQVSSAWVRLDLSPPE